MLLRKINLSLKKGVIKNYFEKYTPAPFTKFFITNFSNDYNAIQKNGAFNKPIIDLPKAPKKP